MKEKFQAFAEKHAELWKFIKFSLVGVSSTVIETIVHVILNSVVFKNISGDPLNILGLLKYEGRGVFYSFVISTTIGYIIAFILNRKTTFNSDANVALSAFLYVLMVIFTIFATAFLGMVFTKWVKSFGIDAANSMWSTIIKLVVAGLATAWTYPLNRFVIHRRKKSEQ